MGACSAPNSRVVSQLFNGEICSDHEGEVFSHKSEQYDGNRKWIFSSISFNSTRITFPLKSKGKKHKQTNQTKQVSAGWTLFNWKLTCRPYYLTFFLSFLIIDIFRTGHFNPQIHLFSAANWRFRKKQINHSACNSGMNSYLTLIKIFTIMILEWPSRYISCFFSTFEIFLSEQNDECFSLNINNAVPRIKFFLQYLISTSIIHCTLSARSILETSITREFIRERKVFYYIRTYKRYILLSLWLTHHNPLSYNWMICNKLIYYLRTF